MERKFYFYTDQMTVGYGGRPLIKNIRIRKIIIRIYKYDIFTTCKFHASISRRPRSFPNTFYHMNLLIFFFIFLYNIRTPVF